jgi:hypothetical protein
LVAIPRTIQGKIDDAVVTVQGISVTQPKANSVHMEMNSTITSGGGVSATIESFNASLYLEDKAGHPVFAYIQMPETTADKVVTANISQTLNIYDAQAYADYNTWYLINETFRVTIDGETYVHVKGLKKTKVNFHKTVTLTGLNGFKGLEVTQSTVSLAADKRGDNFHGYATVPNPSVLTVEIGNATFSNMLNNTEIGKLYIDNMFLYPGPNNVSIRANISQVPVLKAVTTEPYCETGILPLQILGETVVSNGVHLPYYEAGFKQNLQTTELDVGAALAVTLGKKPTCPA